MTAFLEVRDAPPKVLGIDIFSAPANPSLIILKVTTEAGSNLFLLNDDAARSLSDMLRRKPPRRAH
jgi:hypothetical protein